MNIPEEIVEKAARAVKAAIEDEDRLEWWNPDQEYRAASSNLDARMCQEVNPYR